MGAANGRSAGWPVHSGSWSEELDSGGVSAKLWTGIRYCPEAQRPRSINLQRSEQKGRTGLSCQVTGVLQIGQVMAADYNNFALWPGEGGCGLTGLVQG